MTIKTKISIFSIFLALTVGFLPVPVNASGNLVDHSQFLNTTSTDDYDSDKSDEKEQGTVSSVLYLNDSVAFQIVQQPVGNSSFVSPFPNYVTEFRTASNYGAIGLLAHNYLAGLYFFQVLPGQEIELVDSNNRTERFVVTKIQRYQALSPNSPSSDFINLATGESLTASQLFKNIYINQTGHLVLQTCIYTDQNPSWGRLFIIAEPVM
jgi:hypothetical protein